MVLGDGAVSIVRASGPRPQRDCAFARAQLDGHFIFNNRNGCQGQISFSQNGSCTHARSPRPPATQIAQGRTSRDCANNAAERKPTPRKSLGKGLFRLKPLQPLKSHKTAKALFGKAWRKMTEIWKSLEKMLGDAPSFRRLCPSRNAAAAPELARDVPCVSAGSVRVAAAMASFGLASCAITVPGAMAQVCG